MKQIAFLPSIVAGLFSSLALAGTPSPTGVELYLISPADGAVLTSPVTVRFGLKGMGIAPAGIEKKDTGHHHLLIDAALPDLSKPVASDEHHRHFGAGQTETSITLPPGTHTLQLLLGDHNHVPHDPPVVSKPISVTVK